MAGRTVVVVGGGIGGLTAAVALHRRGWLRTVRDDLLVEHGNGISRADLVVGADGLRSEVRRQWWPGANEPRHAGYTAWRMVTEPLAEPPGEGAATWGRGARFGFTSLPGGKVYCFATATVPAGGAGNHAAVLRRFGDWPAPIPALLAAVSYLCAPSHLP